MSQDLSGRVVVVTGGNAGIGLGMAEGCAKAGADIAVWGRRAGRNEEACERLRKHGHRAVGVTCDVSSEESVKSAAAVTVAELGRIDACVASAGSPGYHVPFVDVSLKRWRRVTAVSLDGLFLTFREMARQMIEQGDGGALVAISSVSAVHGAPRNHAYAASKTGILGLTRALAVELARNGIRVNAVLPGWTNTEMTDGAPDEFRKITTSRTPVRRWAESSEFESIGAYLCDPSLAFHTGDSITIDGGYSIF